MVALTELVRHHSTFAMAPKQSEALPSRRVSVLQYLMGRRAEWAAPLPGGTELSIAEIALKTGFSRQAHLTTAFQRMYRMTPAAYRRERR